MMLFIKQKNKELDTQGSNFTGNLSPGKTQKSNESRQRNL